MRRIIEIGIEVNGDIDIDQIVDLLRMNDFKFYIEPPHDPPFASLEDLECQCEGK